MLCSLVPQKTLTKQGKKTAPTPLDLLATSLSMLWHVVKTTEFQTHSFKTLLNHSNLYKCSKMAFTRCI